MPGCSQKVVGGDRDGMFVSVPQVTCGFLKDNNAPDHADTNRLTGRVQTHAQFLRLRSRLIWCITRNGEHVISDEFWCVNDAWID